MHCAITITNKRVESIYNKLYNAMGAFCLFKMSRITSKISDNNDK